MAGPLPDGTDFSTSHMPLGSGHNPEYADMPDLLTSPEASSDQDSQSESEVCLESALMPSRYVDDIVRSRITPGRGGQGDDEGFTNVIRSNRYRRSQQRSTMPPGQGRGKATKSKPKTPTKSKAAVKPQSPPNPKA